jgi:hypothetical protein
MAVRKAVLSLSMFVIVGLGLSSNVFSQTGQDRFVATGNANIGRSGHTATRLKDGRVLLAGGWDASYHMTSAAEIYDPATGQFTMTGSMNVPRVLHSAVLLNDGRVWIVGAYPNFPLQTELYNPDSGTFTFGPNVPYAMGSSAVSSVALVKLLDGTVLIFASNPYSFSNQVFKFDPTSGSITQAGQTLAADYHTQSKTTLLKTGEVLLVNASSVPHGELYNPATNTSRPTANWVQGLVGIWRPGSALLGDGRWVMVGRDDGLNSSAIIFDPTTETFADAGGAQYPGGCNSGAALSDGRALFVGGYPSVALFDPLNNALQLIQPLNSGICRTATPLNDGTVLITGGNKPDGSGFYQAAELFVPKVNIPPVAVAAPVQPVILGKSVTLDGSASHDSDGTITSYRWDFGDGASASGAITSHLYTAANAYTATLTVTDNGGATGTAVVTVTVQTTVQAIGALISVVQEMNLAHGIENSLDQKLQNATDALSATNAANRSDAINKLNAFISATQAQSGKQLTVAQANQLIAVAYRILAVL